MDSLRMYKQQKKAIKKVYGEKSDAIKKGVCVMLQEEKVVRHKSLGFCSGTVHISQPGSRLSRNPCLPQEPDMGIKKCCRLVDTSCNNTFKIQGLGELCIHKVCRVVTDTHPQEMYWSR